MMKKNLCLHKFLNQCLCSLSVLCLSSLASLDVQAVPEKYGSYVGTAIRLGKDAKGNNVSFRALVIRLDDKGDACVVFDGDTLRMAGGWTQGGLKLEGLPFTSGHGRFPSHNGE